MSGVCYDDSDDDKVSWGIVAFWVGGIAASIVGYALVGVMAWRAVSG